MKKNIVKFLSIFSKCKCECGGTIKHIGEEPFGKWNTYKNVYECNKCGKLFV